jgi:hypothetical protein
MKLLRLHRRTEALMTLMAVIAFISGAGFDAPSVLPALLLLVAVTIWEPSPALRRRLEPFWKLLAILLAMRAAYHVVRSPDDIVLPMVDLLLLLLVAEVFRTRDIGNDARVYALTFALLVASAAYRPGALFGIAFVAYMAAATVSLMVGHLLHSIERKAVRDIPLRPRFLAQSAAFSGVALFTSALVFLAFPRVTRGWVSRGLPLAQSVMGFSDRVSLTEHGGQLYPNPELVLRVEFPNGTPADIPDMHWRGLSFDRFNGFEWMRTPGLYQPAVNPDVPRTMLVQHIFGADLPDVSVMFGLHQILKIDGDDPRLITHRNPNGDFDYAGRGPPSYMVYSNIARPTLEQLQSDSGGITPIVAPYLQLPRLTPRMIALADSLSAGTVTTADKVRAVEDYLRPFTYTVTLPPSARQATLDYFLFNRREGHCEYFSTAMAVLLRAMGVPTRNVNGFLGGDWNEFGKFLSVTQNQAHSWVEVWFPRYGWVQFDPTPASLSGLAELRRPMFRKLRAFVDGIDYRWNRWVLEYDMKKQLGLFSRVADAFRAAPNTAAKSTKSNPLRWLMLGGVAVLAVGLMRRRQRGAQKIVAPHESAAYVKLRKAYERRGFPSASAMPPLAFAQRIDSARAPGASDAMRAITFYIRARFNGEELSEDEMQELRSAVSSARAALRSTQ